MNWLEPNGSYQLDRFQQIALGLMAAVTVLTFVGANVQALWWQSSDWLVGTVLPAVVVDLTNNERDSIAVQPLRRSGALDEAAKEKAQHMASNEYFAHFAPDGTSPWYFFDQAGYTYAHAGENLAIHFTDSAEVVDAWMNSPAHKENIVNQNFTEIGVGTAKGSFDGYDTVFVVQLFGTPAAPPTSPTPEEPPVLATEEDEREVANAAVLASLRAELAAIQAQADVLAAADTPKDARPTEDLDQLTAVSEQALLPVTITEAPPLVTEQISIQDDVLVIETELATSSGLAVASVVEAASFEFGSPDITLAKPLTRPSLVLDLVYSTLLSLIIVLLTIALLGETRRLHVVQAAYSLLLIAGVGGLWFVHTTLTSGAVVL